MSLREGQVELQTGVLYDVRKTFEQDQRQINIWINGSVTIYHSNSATQPTSTSDMTVDANSPFVGLQPIQTLPRYIYLDGTATEIIATGIKIEENLGAF